jgi:uncharacterized protein YxeA
MKKIIFLAILMMVLIAGCTSIPKNYSFQEGINELLAIDSKYNATAKETPHENIAPMKAELINFKNKLTSFNESKEILALDLLTTIRLNILDSQFALQNSQTEFEKYPYNCDILSSGLKNLEFFMGNTTLVVENLNKFISGYREFLEQTNINQNRIADFNNALNETGNTLQQVNSTYEIQCK